MPNKLSQQLKQEQTLSLSPIQLLTSKLLELNEFELEQRIEKELVDNPALEEGGQKEDDYEDNEDKALNESEQDWELGEYATEDDIPSYKLRELQERSSFKEEIAFASSSPSLDTLLLDQLSIDGLNEKEEQLARYIIGNISTEGYLTRSVWDLQDDLLFKEGMSVSIEQLESMIRRIKDLDPPGVGAKDLQECLILQLERKNQTDKLIQLALTLIRDHYSDFSAKKFDKLEVAMGISREKLSELYHEISRLNPKPASALDLSYEDRVGHYNPDFIVSEDDEGNLSLNMVYEQDIPALRLNRDYEDMIAKGSKDNNSRAQKEAKDFIRFRLEQARWFIEALHQRQDTLKKTMLAIMSWQKNFFLSGDVLDLKPMILKDIASITGLDLSTISRVSNRKSVQTRHGIYPIKFFFGDGLLSDSGEETTTKAVKQELKKLIDREDSRNPLTDEELTLELSKIGYTLARRTVAKYREALKIPIARLRKKI